MFTKNKIMRNTNDEIEFKFVIDITYLKGITETFTVTTNNVDFIMDQYQRNRDPFTWKIRTTSEV